MNKTKFRFKSFVSVSLPLPESLPKRPLPKKATFDFMNKLTPKIKGLCVYTNRYGELATRRTNNRIPVTFVRYVTGIPSDVKYIEIKMPSHVKLLVNSDQLYFIHEEEERDAA